MPEGAALLGIVLGMVALGFRHGFDWDHIAAITDITSSQRSARTGLRFATLYAAGHAAVVFAIGIVVIVAGRNLPAGVDSFMGRVVGATLIVLGVYVIYALVRYRDDFRMRSRWMLVFSGARRAYRFMRERIGTRSHVVTHDHEHLAAGHHEDGSSSAVAVATHTHTHTHTDPFTNYGTGTSLAVGALHGVGAETPTQVLIFLAAARAGGVAAGIVVLAVFLIGLFAANTSIAAATASGFLTSRKRFPLYATVSVVAAAASLVLGVSFVLGAEDWLPAFF